ncbi:uncharacterized protein F5891DRAFT_1175798 [Suillus fuscotomentosus]|uniref:BTB domain-containing protein n=1 Tax=Suillus fuscotomentosus TaxID=1912939 RepID=A0AAD4HFX0_9AGAM|nr:uncharacterized protein F5891DRAFT_1175798 [Suillus fuscotomentosus]KAG1895032.1 hypothetical protein F5891DRAFT_1175798 [Suillus fuscotomentosus]
MANGSQNGVSRMNCHPQYYLQDGNITFHVEGTLFRVHRHFFERESQFFIQEFAKAPQGGTSDTSAFRLDEVTAANFTKFLWVWYSPLYRRGNLSEPKEHWLTILELSTKWQFLNMQKLAIDELEKLDIEPIEKITTYDKHKIDKLLLLPAYKLLCKRTTRITDEEGEQLKVPTLLRIFEARDRARSAAEGRNLSSADADKKWERILIEVFELNSHATNQQGAQSQTKSDPNSKPNLNGNGNGAANGHKPSGSGSSTQNDKQQQKDADNTKGTAKK